MPSRIFNELRFIFKKFVIVRACREEKFSVEWKNEECLIIGKPPPRSLEIYSHVFSDVILHLNARANERDRQQRKYDIFMKVLESHVLILRGECLGKEESELLLCH